MKHIKICKPRQLTEKASLKVLGNKNSKMVRAEKTSLQGVGLACIPSGNNIDRY